jgi:cell division protein FtsB
LPYGKQAFFNEIRRQCQGATPKQWIIKKNRKKEEKRNTGRVILLIIALVCLIAGLAYIGVDLYQQYTARQEDRRSQSMVTEAPSTTGKSKKPPIR